jgi:hypothetical protein
MVYGINYFGRGLLGAKNYLNYVRHDVLGTDLLNSSLKFVPVMARKYQALNSTAGVQMR